MATSETVEFDNLEDLIEALGGIKPRRVKLVPPPGTATEADLLRQNERKTVLCELVAGTLVEKAMGTPESFIGGDIYGMLWTFVRANRLGEVAPGDAFFRILPGTVRGPDACYISTAKLPGGCRPTAAIPGVVPDLVAEVLSRGNTLGEMLQKRKEYFIAGVLLVWEVDPRKRTISVYTDPATKTTLTEDDTLTGGEVLPGFSVPVREVFARVPRPEPKPRRKKK